MRPAPNCWTFVCYTGTLRLLRSSELAGHISLFYRHSSSSDAAHAALLLRLACVGPTPRLREACHSLRLTSLNFRP